MKKLLTLSLALTFIVGCQSTSQQAGGNIPPANVPVGALVEDGTELVSPKMVDDYGRCLVAELAALGASSREGRNNGFIISSPVIERNGIVVEYYPAVNGTYARSTPEPHSDKILARTIKTAIHKCR